MLLDVVVASLDIIREERLVAEFCKVSGYDHYIRNFYHGTAHMAELDRMYEASKETFLNNRQNNTPFWKITGKFGQLQRMHRVSNKIETIKERRDRAIRDVAPIVNFVDSHRLRGLIGDVPFDVLDPQHNYVAANARQEKWIEAGLPNIGATMSALEDRLTNYVMQNSNQPLGFNDDPNFRFRYNSKRAEQVSKTATRSLRKLEAIAKRQAAFVRAGYKAQKKLVPA